MRGNGGFFKKMGLTFRFQEFESFRNASKKLFAVGGGVKNKIWTSSISNISGFDQIIKSKTIGASYGNAFLGALSVGDVKRKDIDDWNQVSKIIKAKCNPIYSKQYELFKALYKNTSDLMG